MASVKKEKWTDQQVLALPPGEHDYFDRKSGGLLQDSGWRATLAKALSAFANSGGGHLILGAQNDGTFDGVSQLRSSRTSTREWLEQVIPNLLTYPLEDFRVHVVEPAPSGLPAGRVLIVIDVGDSALAPHQSAEDRTYYYREGGHSKPSPHFYLETLRNRLVRPSLEAKLTEIKASRSYAFEGGVFLEMILTFTIKNTGGVAAYKWALALDSMSGHAEDRTSDYRHSFESFPLGNEGRSSSISLDDTILPTLSRAQKRDFGVHLRPPSLDITHIETDLRHMMSSKLTLHFRAITETSPGETKSQEIGNLIDYRKIAESVLPLAS